MNKNEPGLVEYAIVLILIAALVIGGLAVIATLLNVFVVGLWAAIVAAVAGIGYALYEAARGEMWAVVTVLITTGICCILPMIGVAIALTRVIRGR